MSNVLWNHRVVRWKSVDGSGWMFDGHDSHSYLFADKHRQLLYLSVLPPRAGFADAGERFAP